MTVIVDYLCTPGFKIHILGLRVQALGSRVHGVRIRIRV